MKSPTRIACLLLSLTFCAYGPSQVEGQESNEFTTRDFDSAAEKLAQMVKGVAPPGEDDNRIFIWQFRGIGLEDVGFAKILGDKLESLDATEDQPKYVIHRDARTQVEGRLLRQPLDESLAPTGVKVMADVVFHDGRKRSLEVVNLKNKRTAQMIFVSTGETLSPPFDRAKPPAREDRLPKQNPVAKEKTQSRLYPSNRSPYSAEILLDETPDISDPRQKETIALPIFMSNGHPTVTIPKGSTYIVKVYNESQYKAAIDTRIDGLHRFVLADDQQLHRGAQDIVEPNEARMVVGWYRDSATADGFKVGSYSRSVAAQKLPGVTDDTGTIVIGFSVAVHKDDKLPGGEPSQTKGIGTTRGEKVNDPTQKVDDLKFGAVRAILRIRYVSEEE